MSMQGKGMSGGESPMRTPHVGASQVTMYLKNIDFPTDKRKIVDMAKSNGAPETVMQMLNKLPDKQYTRSNELEQEFSKMM
jgi:hypothetical protein